MEWVKRHAIGCEVIKKTFRQMGIGDGDQIIYLI